jgi:hypothetical protein
MNNNFREKITFPVLIQNKIYYLFFYKKLNWLISIEQLSQLFKIEQKNLLNIIQNKNNNFLENKHFVLNKNFNCLGQKNSEVFLVSKKGILKLAYFLDSDEVIEIIDELEDIDLTQECFQIFEQKNQFFIEIESILKNKLEILKNNESVSLSQINEFIETISILIQREKESKSAFFTKNKNKTEDFSLKNIFLSFIEESLNKTAEVKTQNSNNFQKK